MVKKPASFDGKMVRIKGTVAAGLDEFVIKDAADPNCGFQVDAIWLSYPAGTKAKSGPVAMVTVQPAKNFAGAYKAPARAPVTLEKSKDFKQFDNLLAQPHQKGADMCLGCARYEVTATLVGRLDAVADATLKRDDKGKIIGFGGFGNMNAYPARLVLQSVADVTPKEVDYSKSDAMTKGDAVLTPPPSMGSGLDDPVANIQRMASHMGSSEGEKEFQRAAGAYPKPKEQNGVSVTWGVANEALPQAEELGARESPDGVLFNCTFYRDHLQGNAVDEAIVHIGEHIADLRSPKPGNEGAPAFILENDAWVITSIAAVGTRVKYLTLPGGYLFWDSAWPEADRNDKMSTALNDFLSNEALLSR